MRRFRLLEYLAAQGDSPEQFPLVERDLLLQIIRQADPQRGWSLDELRQGVRLLDAVEPKQTGEVVELEDADFDVLLGRVRAFRWAWVDRRIDKFVRHIENATQDVPDESGLTHPQSSNGTEAHAEAVT